MSDQPPEEILNKRPSRRAIMRGTLIGLGAALLVQPQGGSAQDTPKKEDSKKGKKKGGKKKEETPKKEGS
ncbi:MAG TPA: hypothetical protein VMJ34_19510 [Bryobacteraceae bacterium]|nr:hypothetical protein [Bryobacteraceae bacterium]